MAHSIQTRKRQTESAGNVSKELLEKAQRAKTKEEALAILGEGGVELTEEDLKNISGGEEEEGICWTHKTPCSFLCDTHGDKCIAFCYAL